MLFIKYRDGVQVVKGLKVVGRYDTIAQAQAAHPTAVIAAGHRAKLNAPSTWKVDKQGIPYKID